MTARLPTTIALFVCLLFSPPARAQTAACDPSGKWNITVIGWGFFSPSPYLLVVRDGDRFTVRNTNGWLRHDHFSFTPITRDGQCAIEVHVDAESRRYRLTLTRAGKDVKGTGTEEALDRITQKVSYSHPVTVSGEVLPYSDSDLQLDPKAVERAFADAFATPPLDCHAPILDQEHNKKAPVEIVVSPNGGADSVRIDGIDQSLDKTCPALASGLSDRIANPTARQQTVRFDFDLSRVRGTPRRQQKAYEQAMRKGSELARKKQYRDAMSAFREAASAWDSRFGHDGRDRALSELSAAALAAGDAREAESAARAAVEEARDVALRASLEYNLGLSLINKDKDDAIEALSHSLADHPSSVVRKRLAALDPKAARSADPLTPRPLEGPYRALESFCEKRKSTLCRDGQGIPLCTPNKKDASLKRPIAPIEAAYVFTSGCDDTGDSQDLSQSYNLALRTNKGWYVLPDIATSSRYGGSNWDDLSVHSLTILRPAPDKGPVLILRVQQSSGTGGGHGSHESLDEQSVVFAGVGPSGVPSATRPFLVASSLIDSDRVEQPLDEQSSARLAQEVPEFDPETGFLTTDVSDYALSFSLTPQGEVELVNRRHKVIEREPLAFP